MATKGRPKKNQKLSELLLGNVKEIAPNITIEKLSAQFFDATKLKYQLEPLYRLDVKDYRYYYRFENDEPIFYTSVTTLIKNTLPTNVGLIKWIADRGSEDAQAEATERAHYGTFMHVQCGKLLVNGKYDLDKLQDKLTVYLIANNITQTKSWSEELKKDILAFAQFVIDYNVKPLAVEICLYHPTDGYAGAIDLICEMDWRKGRIKAIVDLKSGRKGFYESNEIQLHAYLAMWNIHFPDTPIDKVFNWSPKDFRGTIPTYNFKDQTESKNLGKLPHLVALAKIEDSKRENKITVIGGNIDLLGGLEKNINEYSFVELIKKNK